MRVRACVCVNEIDRERQMGKGRVIQSAALCVSLMNSMHFRVCCFNDSFSHSDRCEDVLRGVGPSGLLESK